MSMTIGSKKKRDIAFVVASLLDRDRTYTAKEIEVFIRSCVKSEVLGRRGFAPDHLRRAMIENGYVKRDAKTNQTWVAESFEGAKDIHGPMIADLKSLMETSPDTEKKCPVCGKRLKAVALFNHYQKKHADREPWERLMEQYFG